MPISGGGQAGSGLDRALQQALDANLDDTLLTGEIFRGERKDYPDAIGDTDPDARPWQMSLGSKRKPPADDESLRTIIPSLWARLTGSAPKKANIDRRPQAGAACPEFSEKRSPSPAAAAKKAKRREQDALLALRALLTQSPTESDLFKFNFRFREELTGVVMVHGIGPQLAGQTLLDWVRPIVTLIGDVRATDPRFAPRRKESETAADGDRSRAAKRQAEPQAEISDPVYKSNIDFSGETFPVVQIRIPGRTDVAKGDPRASERTWIVTETWWASEVRPPTLRTMIDWLGEQGGVSRIVQGIQENMLGQGVVGTIARVSVQAFVSVIVSFVLLVLLALLGISRLIPFGPLQDAVTLRVASSFITDWFGGARTLLRDPAQSANVRGRLVATIKALRAYGCRHVVIVAHSGGTMVSLMTLTDPAYSKLRVDKLVTIGEALNLGWRLEDSNPDATPATPPQGNRMRGDLAVRQPTLQWRDFWATHDPAPSGAPPQLPKGMTNPPAPQFTAERVYNRMSIGEDHGGYWANDEHFLIPLIREIDVPTGDRGGSRFFCDEAESQVRARRKERVALLALWRRGMLALPIMTILAAAITTSGGLVRQAGDVAMAAFGLVPGNELVGDASATLAANGAAAAIWVVTWHQLYLLGILTLAVVFVLLLVLAVVPARVDRQWRGRPFGRVVLIVIDLAIGVVAFGVIVVTRFVGLGHPATAGGGPEVVLLTAAVTLAALIGAFWWMGLRGRELRARIRGLEGSNRVEDRLRRDVLIVVSAVVLSVFLGSLLVVMAAVALAFAGNEAAVDAGETRRFILGAIVVLLSFQVLGRLGTWRWEAWDARERRALRRRPMAYPHRYWSYILAALLTSAAVGGALIVAIGFDAALAWLLAGILGIVILSVGKDVVDNDIDTGEAGAGGAATGQSGTLVPGQPSGPPAGDAAS